MIAVIGGGVCGLTAAIRLAEQGVQVELFEAAPELGGRTRSFLESTTGESCDNGPHLLIGAYRHTLRLLGECGAAGNIHWQSTLDLPLWDRQRGHFRFRPSPLLPFPIALAKAGMEMPGHDLGSVLAMLRLGKELRSSTAEKGATVRQWLADLNIPEQLVRDLLEPLCLGAMNEATDTASAASFQQVLKEAFAGRSNARLGWFNKPLSEALIEPLAARAKALGVKTHRRSRIRTLAATKSRIRIDERPFDAAILALPAHAAAKLLGHDDRFETRTITNIHLWFDQKIEMPAPLVGGIGTHGHWFFDIPAQMKTTQSRYHHICIVTSGGTEEENPSRLASNALMELQAMCRCNNPISPIHSRTVREKRATTLVRPHARPPMPSTCLVDACEWPQPGELPATIESAVRRGERAAKACLATCFPSSRP